MARVPRFAWVGRLALPVAAIVVALALWSTTTWALASPHASSTPQPAAGPAEAVSVGIPSVVFGRSDRLPAHVLHGTHQAVIAVWLAAGSPASLASVTAVGGEVRGCSHVPLRPAAVTTLRCAVVANGSALTLLARTTVAGQAFQQAYSHH